MFIQLHEYYYDYRCHCYFTRIVCINSSEISDFHVTLDLDRVVDGVVKVSLKNGRTYNVKETCTEIVEKLTAIENSSKE